MQRKSAKKLPGRSERIKDAEWYKQLEREKQEVLKAQYAFKDLAREQKARCAVCRKTPRDAFLQVHHVVSKQRLKQINRQDLLWDRRNGLVLCEKCHSRHESAFQRVRRELLTDENIEFALEIDHGWWIERFYPKEV